MLDAIDLLTLGKKTKDDSIFLIFGEISDEIAQLTIEWIINSNMTDKPPKVLTIMINSAGGDLPAAWAIIDVIRGSHVPVRIIGLGQIASAGLLIFASGQKGSRILTENTSIMSHQYNWGSVGKHHELMAVQKEYTLTQKRLIAHFKKVTDLTEEQIDEYLMPPHDVYMSAEEALKLGLCDIIQELK